MAWPSDCRRASKECWRPTPVLSPFAAPASILSATSKSVAVIDPGPNDPEHVASLLAAIGDREVNHILITHTHRDHSPAALPLKQATGAKTYGFGPHMRNQDEVEEGGDRDFVPDVTSTRWRCDRGRWLSLFSCVFTPGPYLQPHVLCAGGGKCAVHRRPCDGLVHQRGGAARWQYGRLYAQPGKADRPR